MAKDQRKNEFVAAKFFILPNDRTHIEQEYEGIGLGGNPDLADLISIIEQFEELQNAIPKKNLTMAIQVASMSTAVTVKEAI